MKRKWIIALAIFLFILAMGLAFIGSYSEYGKPAEFGNLTTTTCWIGGDNGIVNCTGRIGGANFTGNVLASWFKGNINWSYVKNVPSTIGASYPSSVNLTSTSYNASLGGYEGANSKCDSEFSGSHLCNEFEVVRAYNNDNVNLNNVDAWVSAGGPKYVPANIPVDDCKGWTYAGTATHLGNYWHFNSTTGGTGRAINCGTELNLSCCSY